LFYYFQYAFAIRSGLDIDPFDYSSILNVMRQLAVNHEDYHFRNEFIPIEPPSNARKNKPFIEPHFPLPIRQRMSLQQRKRFSKYRNDLNLKREPVALNRGPVLHTATIESPYRGLMLNNGEWLKSKNKCVWNDFTNLYRALLIYDLFQSGETADSIYSKYGGECIQDMTPVGTIRCCLVGGETALDVLIPYLINSISNNSDTRLLLLEQAAIDSIAFIGDGDSDGCVSKLYIRRIQRHYERALQLIQLAVTGAFKTFPPILLPLH